MDSQTNVQKRKRAITLEDQQIIDGAADNEDTIIVDDSRHGLPFITEDNPEDSDVDQLDNDPLEESTLFWSMQLIISTREDDQIGLGKPSAEHQLKGTLLLIRMLFIY
jgi:hypothetical protein